MPGDVLIRQLEYLVALAHERHFGRAAAACHASQPALSAAIRKLEAELGVTIVQRGHRFGGFTAEGQRVVGWAHRILAERDGLASDLDRMRDGPHRDTADRRDPDRRAGDRSDHRCGSATAPAGQGAGGGFSSREIVRRLAEFELDVGLTYLDAEARRGHDGLELYRERYSCSLPVDGALVAATRSAGPRRPSGRCAR